MKIETSAKVRFSTSKGNIDIELYAKEIPIACRAFLQNCVDKKYVGLLFDRLLPDLVEVSPKSQENQIRREFHSRVKFTGRGSVSLLNVEDSQLACPDGFFITLQPLSEFNNQYVIIGKVVGDLIYNVVKIQEAEKQQDGITPLYPVSITGVEILQPFFDDLKKVEEVTDTRKRKKAKTSVKLSYDDEEDGEVDGFVMKSAHELLMPGNVKTAGDTGAKSISKEDKKESEEDIDSQNNVKENPNEAIDDRSKNKADDNPQAEDVIKREDDTHNNDAKAAPIQSSNVSPSPFTMGSLNTGKAQSDPQQADGSESDEESDEEREPLRDPSIDPYHPILDMWQDTVDFRTLQNHSYKCR